MADLSDELKKMNLEPDERAFIMQQVQEFSPYFMSDSQVGISIQKQEKEKNSEFSVQMILTGGGTFVKSEGRGDNLFSAARNAKTDLLNHLESVFQEVQEHTLSDADYHRKPKIVH